MLLIARPSDRRVSLLPSFPVERVEACGKTVPVVGRWMIAKFMTADPVSNRRHCTGTGIPFSRRPMPIDLKF